jgi:hypothetical protein
LYIKQMIASSLTLSLFLATSRHHVFWSEIFDHRQLICGVLLHLLLFYLLRRFVRSLGLPSSKGLQKDLLLLPLFLHTFPFFISPLVVVLFLLLLFGFRSVFFVCFLFFCNL